jgi:hypothetical protein
MVAPPFVRGAFAAGKLSVGFWDHWVPNANSATETLIKQWAEKEKVEVQIDFITTQDNKLLLTGAAESQAKSGHDNGKVNGTVEYLGKVGGKWLAVPATSAARSRDCARASTS